MQEVFVHDRGLKSDNSPARTVQGTVDFTAHFSPISPASNLSPASPAPDFFFSTHVAANFDHKSVPHSSHYHNYFS